MIFCESVSFKEIYSINILPAFKYFLCIVPWNTIQSCDTVLNTQSTVHTNRHTDLRFKSTVTLSKHHTSYLGSTRPQWYTFGAKASQITTSLGKEKPCLYSARCWAELTCPQDDPDGKPASRKYHQKLYSISSNTFRSKQKPAQKSH